MRLFRNANKFSFSLSLSLSLSFYPSLFLSLFAFIAAHCTMKKKRARGQKKKAEFVQLTPSKSQVMIFSMS